MHLLHAIPNLLQLVHDAEDDGSALGVGCAWLERHAGVDRAAMVTADAGRLVAKRGWTVADLEHGELGEFLRTGQPTASRGSAVMARAPILSAGLAIGHVVARSRWDAAKTVEEAVQSVAAICAPAFRGRVDAFTLAAEAHTRVPEIMGRSPAIAGVRESVVRAAMTSFAVLIEGESGTGKELVARALHRLSRRASRRFCAINCAALTDELIEAELFGFARGALREDLMYRLAVVRVRMPTLRDRVEDVPQLAQTFWRQVSLDGGKWATLGPDAIAALCRHHWPGNVRELQNVVSALMVAAPVRGRVSARHVAQVLGAAGEAATAPAVPLDRARRTFERRAVAAALARHGGRRSAAARELGLTRQGLAKAIKRLGLAPTPGVEGVA